MEPRYQKAYAIEGIAQKWVEDENEDDYVDTGDMLRDFGQILELSRELMAMLQVPNEDGEVNAACVKCGRTDKFLFPNMECTECYDPEENKGEPATEPTLTIFRKYPDGDVIALFPEIEGAPGTCVSYMRVGQHGSAHYHHVVQKTKLATPEEYAALATELISIGYNLKIKQKWMTWWK